MRRALSFALCLCCAVGWAGSYSDVSKKLEQTRTPAEILRIVAEDKSIASQPDIKNTLARSDIEDSEIADRVKAQIELRAMAEQRVQTSTSDQKTASEIKRSFQYRDPGFERKRNWLGESLERLRNIHLDWKPPQSDIQPPAALGSTFTYIIWLILGAGVLALLYFAIRHINWQKTLTRKSKALLEENEPDRTLDEWLALADDLTSQGRYREAVRALFLACLIKFDEADIARFDRGETNWEHLARIEASPQLPSGLDFRSPTQRFDRVWYGFQVNGMADVDLFRGWYEALGDRLREAKA